MKMNKFALIAITIGVLFTSCTTDNNNNVEFKGDYEEGILISNEGNFTDGNGTISYISNDYLTIENNVFLNVNNRALGAVAQSITFDGDLAYIVVNVSSEIEVVNRYTFESIATIDTEISNPRFMAISNGMGYVTAWGDGYVATDDVIVIVNLSTNTVESTIPVAEGPEQILAVDGKLFVSHKGGYSTNNIISVIESTTNVVETIPVGDVPDEMIINNAGDLVVLSEGANQYWLSPAVVTLGGITKINTSNNTVISTINFGEGLHPSLMTYSDGKLYYKVSDQVYSMADSATILPTESVIDVSFNGNGMAVKNGFLYGVDAGDFSSNGSLKVYDLNSNTETQSITVGVNPGKIYFN